MSKQEKIWRSEEDARTFAEAEDIIKDKTRLSSAKKQAKIMVRDQERRVLSLKKVANKLATTKKK